MAVAEGKGIKGRREAASRRDEGAKKPASPSGVGSVIASVVDGQRCLRCDGAIAVEDTAHWPMRTLLHCAHCEVVYRLDVEAPNGIGRPPYPQTLVLIDPHDAPELYRASLADIAAARKGHC